jgi:hypothetical protein
MCGGSMPKQPLASKYANYFEVGFRFREFLLDFGEFYDEEVPADLHTRIITNPEHVKTLAQMLQRVIAEYEQAFGSIKGGVH